MNQKTFSLIAGIIFALVALGHLLRLFQGWTILINGWPVPMWISWIGLIIPAILAVYGLRFGSKP
ncbi:MAG: hypothetical protein KGJ06_08305 [Pseudomonadota bacterium]|nr:hypothetical protein [Pseudomonadota bacterium]